MKEIKLRVHSKKSNCMFKWHGYSGLIRWFFTELLLARSQQFLTAGKIQLHANITSLTNANITVKFSPYTVYWAFTLQRPSNSNKNDSKYILFLNASAF